MRREVIANHLAEMNAVISEIVNAVQEVAVKIIGAFRHTQPERPRKSLVVGHPLKPLQGFVAVSDVFIQLVRTARELYRESTRPRWC
jgi:hypothetical protein